MRVDSVQMRALARWRKDRASAVSRVDADQRSALDALEPDQLSATLRDARYGKRRLGPGTLTILWALRIYVALMAALVLHQLIIAL